MKKILLLIFVALISTTMYSQKKKSTIAVNASPVLAKVDNLVAEVKTGNYQLTITENGKPKETIIIKAADAKFSPLDVKLTTFSANGTKLYLLVWTEKSQNNTELKTEDSSTIFSNIYDIKSKKLVLTNTQLTVFSTEKVYLDQFKNASETQEKIKREGFEFTLNTDGSVIRKSKSQQNKFIYDTTQKEYVIVKKK